MTRIAPGVSRRDFLHLGTAVMVASRLTPPDVTAFGGEYAAFTKIDPASIKALVFDTFGTVVDWRGGVAQEVAALAKRKGFTVDAPKFADAWRAGYGPSMNRVRSGELPWTKLDDLHRMTLEKILVDFNITGISEADKHDLTYAWHRLKSWPDAVSGLTRLKRKFIIAPLSNGNVGLMTDMAKFAGLPWDCILGAELVRHYKPDKEVYLSAAEFLGLKVGEVMMVAAHLGDLRAAKAVGLPTAFVPRPLEFGPGRKGDTAPDESVDVSARDFNDLAAQLGA
jgi:2-haloacid dehalogenase